MFSDLYVKVVNILLEGFNNAEKVFLQCYYVHLKFVNYLVNLA
jgi:hypothetical protein